MTSVRRAPGEVGEADPRLRRCCRTHPDWTVLGEHLCSDFPAVPREDVLCAVSESRDAAKLFQLAPHDEIDTVELIARSRLVALTSDPAAHNQPRRMRLLTD